MNRLMAEDEKCSSCKEMSECIFRNLYSGTILISKDNLKNQDVLSTVEKVRNACPLAAITLEPF